MEGKAVWKSAIWLLGAVGLAILCAKLLFLFDNKYTARSPVTQDGATLVNTEQLAANGLFWLADGWELYPDALLALQELAAYQPVHTYVGQYLNLIPFHENRSPYGQATWRLRLRYDGEPVSAVLLLPEVFSVCRVYWNGEEVAGSGSFDPYQPDVRDLVFPLELAQEAELVVQTANFSHYYSGLTYPPALGRAEAVYAYVGVRMGFYGLLCFASLALALFSAATWWSKPRRDRLAFWLGILSLSFSVRVCYPFMRLFQAPLDQLFYMLEDAASMLGIWCALRIVLILCGLTYRRWASVVTRVAGAAVAVAALFPVWVLPALPAFATVYGWFLSAYKLLTALLLCSLAFFAGWKGKQGAPFLLAGVAFYGVGLAANISTIGVFEPIYTGWQDEYGVFVLVLCFAALMVQRNHRLLRENARLTEQLQEEVDQKTSQVTKLLAERDRILSELIHDMKSPAATIATYTQLIRENKVELDQKTLRQLQTIEEKCRDMDGKIQSMQELAIHNAVVPQWELLDLRDFLRAFHKMNQPDVEVYGPDFLLKLPREASVIRGDRTLLNRMLQNLVYNAASFTPPEGKIILKLERDEQNAVIRLCDTGCGIPKEALPKLFERFFTTRSDQGGKGLGLYIVKQIVEEHGGNITVKSRVGKGSQFIIRLPLQER